MNWSSLKDHVLQAVATAAVLGSGTLLLKDQVEIAQIEQRVRRTEEILTEVKEIRHDVSASREDIVRMKTLMEAQQNDHRQGL